MTIRSHLVVSLLWLAACQALAQSAPVPAPPPSVAAPPPTQSLVMPGVKDRPTEPPAGLSSEKVKSISIGKDGGSSSKAETLRDLEVLQRQVYFQELKAKARELEAAHQVQVRPPEMVAFGGGVPQSTGFVPPAVPPVLNGAQTSYGVGVALPAPALEEEPQARLLNLIVTPTRTRADVISSGTAMTVKEGDEIGSGWKVASITPSGVLVEKVVTSKELDRANAAPARVSRGKAAAPRKAQKWIDVERTISAKLKPAEQSVPTENSAGVQPTPPAGQGMAAAMPPLPPALRPADSTSVSSAAPLGPNAALLPQPTTAAAQLPRLPR